MLGYVEIRFGQSTSASYAKVLRAAQQFSGFQEASQDAPYNSVRVESPQLSAEYKHLRRLWDGISGWRSAEFLIDGRPGAFHDLYTLVRYVECADKREVSPQPGRYCEKSHSGGQGWGCRYLSATEREPAAPRYSFGTPPTGWWDFGAFDADGRFVVRKEHIRDALQKEAERAGLSFCPQFDFQRVSAAVDALPDVIDPSASNAWEVIYEDHADGCTISQSAVGVRPAAERPVAERRLTPQQDTVDRHVPEVSFDDVGGIDEIVQTIREVIELPDEAAAALRPHGNQAPQGCAAVRTAGVRQDPHRKGDRR